MPEDVQIWNLPEFALRDREQAFVTRLAARAVVARSVLREVHNRTRRGAFIEGLVPQWGSDNADVRDETPL